jgi:NADH:ubiquinone oxidoreductase subunit 3 (subunit A)
MLQTIIAIATIILLLLIGVIVVAIVMLGNAERDLMEYQRKRDESYESAYPQEGQNEGQNK